MDEDEKRRRKEEEDNERLLREFLAAEEKARIAEAERAAAAVKYVVALLLFIVCVACVRLFSSSCSCMFFSRAALVARAPFASRQRASRRSFTLTRARTPSAGTVSRLIS